MRVVSLHTTSLGAVVAVVDELLASVRPGISVCRAKEEEPHHKIAPPGWRVFDVVAPPTSPNVPHEQCDSTVAAHAGEGPAGLLLGRVRHPPSVGDELAIDGRVAAHPGIRP